jgi:hypothetical protein
VIGDDEVLTAARARNALDSACADLDGAVSALGNIADDDVMASPGLVALLLRVVVARRELAGVESFLTGVGGAVADRTRWV